MNKTKTNRLNREQHIEQIYQRAFPKVAAFVRKMNGTLDEAKDVFQDALLLFYEKQQAKTSAPLKSEEAYVIGIAKHLWYKQHSESKPLTPLNEALKNYLPEEQEPHVGQGLLGFIEQSGKKCLDLLSSFYYEQLNMKDIAIRFGFSGERSATAQKFKCLEKVRQAVKQRALSKEDFYV